MPNGLKHNSSFAGEVLLGHLRYGTFGKNTIEHCHPFHRKSNWKSRNLVLAGNFNLTNVEEIFQSLVEFGQSPSELSDSITMLEKIGHFLDEENNLLLAKFRALGISEREVYSRIQREINVRSILEHACKKWDGGFAICGLLGHGDSFVYRDPSGIRPAYYYVDDEIIVATSERPPIQTAFNVSQDKIKEITPGHALIVKVNGSWEEVLISPTLERKSCSFERIYFSRGSDADIYRERKKLGELLVPKVMESIDHDLENTVFSYIPNTAEVAFYGLIHGLQNELSKQKSQKIALLINSEAAITSDDLEKIMTQRIRMEKIAVKDAKLRTFITEDSSRDDLVAHVYDTTYGVIQPDIDNLVVLDDSIVRGTTLKHSIIKILDRLKPKKIIIVSSAPQIRFPDCYGIDMAKLGEFIAFEAAIDLLKENSRETLILQVYEACKEELKKCTSEIQNVVNRLFEPFNETDISSRISKLLRPEGVHAEIEIIYQNINDLHKACPNHLGDWYFSGNYPTPGGNRVVCQSFVNYIEGINKRAY
jgi:amidophosphoribosyltransferase